MKAINQKHQILESLDSLDQIQAQKVLDYIKALLEKNTGNEPYQKLKAEAMQQIRQALRGRI